MPSGLPNRAEERWANFIDRLSGYPPGTQFDVINDHLKELTESDLIELEHYIANEYAGVYSYDVLAAAFASMGGVTDDSFMDFREWLVFQGRRNYSNIARNEEFVRLAEEWEGRVGDPRYLGVVRRAYEERFGREMKTEVIHPSELSGSSWTLDEFHVLYPELSKWFRIEEGLPAAGSTDGVQSNGDGSDSLDSASSSKDSDGEYDLFSD